MKTLLSLLSVTLFFGCGEKAQDTDVACQIPVAEAGSDVVVSLGQAANVNASESILREKCR